MGTRSDWKEKFNKEFFNGQWDVASCIPAFDWIEKNVIQPLQAKNEALQKEVDELKLMWANSLNRLFSEKGQLQKENAELKAELASYPNNMNKEDYEKYLSTKKYK